MSRSATTLLNRLLARGKFRHLQVLLRVAELGSVQRAAGAIGLTQSAVTQTLAYLEGLLEQRLFTRHARGVTPTPACLELLPVARQLLLGLADGAERMAARGEGAGIVRLLASAAAVQGLLLPLLPPFHARHPQLQVLLREAEGEDQLVALARGEVDLIACRRPVAVPAGWRHEALCADRFVVVAPAGHPVLARRRIGWAALARETWLLTPAESVARRALDELSAQLAPAGHTALRAHPLVTRSPAVMLVLMQQARLLALLPLSNVQQPLAAGQLRLVPVPAQPALAALEPLGLLLPETGASTAATRLADHLRATAAPLLPLADDQPASGSKA